MPYDPDLQPILDGLDSRLTALEGITAGLVGDEATDNAPVFADLLAEGAPIIMCPGRYRTTEPLAFTGKAVPIRAESPGDTIIVADHDGPIFDFSELGWDAPENAAHKITYRGISLEGSGSSDPAHRGILITPDSQNHSPSSLAFHEMAIANTGGEAAYVDRAYFIDLVDVVLNEPPTGAAYATLRGANGSELERVLFRGYGNAGAAGVLRIEDTAEHTTDGLLVARCMTEFCQIPTGSQVVYVEGGQGVEILNWRRYDDGVQGPPADTYYARFVPSPILGLNPGGNVWEGWIPGDDEGVFAAGILVESSRNSIRGRKGYPGHNVELAPGAEYNVVRLEGQVSQTPGNTQPSVIDNSGTDTNVVEDTTNGDRNITG